MQKTVEQANFAYGSRRPLSVTEWSAGPRPAPVSPAIPQRPVAHPSLRSVRYRSRSLLPSEIDLGAVLDAFPGVSYVTDAEGVLVSCSTASWRRFAEENGGDAVADPGRVIGTSIFDAMHGGEVQASQVALADALLDGGVDRHAYEFRCDSPALEREMLMTVARIELPDERPGLLYHSVLLRERAASRPEDGAYAMSAPPDETPTVTLVCSYCRAVLCSPDGQSSDWLSHDQASRLLGTPPRRVSHGMCPDCFTRMTR